MAEMQVIAAKVFDPTGPSIFKKNKSDRAQFMQILCECESCPLRARKECVQVSIFNDRCPHGSRRDEEGPTQRARGFYSWIKERKKLAEPYGWMSFATKKLAFIGDYVYVPYPHADMHKEVPFLRRSGLMTGGMPFIKKEDWTLDNVLRLLEFRPQALLGGTISSYQAESVPAFLGHLREVDPAMWSQLISARPSLDVAPNYVGRTAILRTLAHPITIPAYKKECPVEWLWDGEYATTTNRHGYEKTWGRIEPDEVEVRVKPAQNASVVVADNAWVTSETVFVD